MRTIALLLLALAVPAPASQIIIVGSPAAVPRSVQSSGKWTPRSWSDCGWWFRGDSGVTDDTSSPPNVSAWVDQCPSAITYNTPGGTVQFTASGRNGQPCITFAANGYLQNSTAQMLPVTPADFQMWWVVKPVAYASFPAIFNFKTGGSLNDVSIFFTTGATYKNVTFGAQAASPYGSTRASADFATSDGSAWYAIGLSRASGVYQWYNVTTAATTASSANDGSTDSVNYLGNFGATTEGVGTICDGFEAAHAATAGDLTNVQGYLSSRYAF